MYSCQEVMAELATYLDDQISSGIRQQLEAHLAHCSTCTVIYDSTRKTVKIVTDSRSFELPEDLSARLMKKIMSTIRSGRAPDPPDDPTS